MTPSISPLDGKLRIAKVAPSVGKNSHMRSKYVYAVCRRTILIAGENFGRIFFLKTTCSDWKMQKNKKVKYVATIFGNCIITGQ